jgi:hypothetical protein
MGLKHVASVLCTAGLFLACPAVAQSLDGVWQSEGFGNVYEISSSSLRAFEVTATTCVASFTAKRLAASSPEREGTFQPRHQPAIFIGPGVDDNHKLLSRPDGLYRLRLYRLAQEPAVCSGPTPNTPSGNFEVFTQTFAEHYISFRGRQVDWEKTVSINRARVTPQTTPAQLFDILDSMIKPLGDLHTGIEHKPKRESAEPFRAGTDRVIQGGIDNFATKGRRALFRVTDGAWSHGPIRSFCRGQIQFAISKEGTGYIRILSFGDYARRGGDKRELESALDKIFSEEALKALVIDVRLSFGGDDGLGLLIASRLTDRKYLAYSIEARADPVAADRWTGADAVFVRPSPRPGFRGPVVELTGPITMSAAETFTEALMGRTPPVERIGENTQGLFCDPLGRHLPNGWEFVLPNAVYRTAEGKAFDVQGIPPTIDATVFGNEDVAAGRDPSMSMAIGILRAQD